MSSPHTGSVLVSATGQRQAVWAVLFLIGWAQAAINFLLWLHLVERAPGAGSYGIWRVVAWIALLAAIGHCGERIIGRVWGRAHRC